MKLEDLQKKIKKSHELIVRAGMLDTDFASQRYTVEQLTIFSSIIKSADDLIKEAQKIIKESKAENQAEFVKSTKAFSLLSNNANKNFKEALLLFITEAEKTMNKFQAYFQEYVLTCNDAESDSSISEELEDMQNKLQMAHNFLEEIIMFRAQFNEIKELSNGIISYKSNLDKPIKRFSDLLNEGEQHINVLLGKFKTEKAKKSHIKKEVKLNLTVQQEDQQKFWQELSELRDNIKSLLKYFSSIKLSQKDISIEKLASDQLPEIISSKFQEVVLKLRQSDSLLKECDKFIAKNNKLFTQTDLMKFQKKIMSLKIASKITLVQVETLFSSANKADQATSSEFFEENLAAKRLKVTNNNNNMEK